MPEGEGDDWTFVDDKGFQQAIVRPAHALRVWDPATQKYAPVDPLLGGAPSNEQEADAWYVDLIRKLKQSIWLGSELIEQLVCCESYEIDPKTDRPKEGSYSGEVRNHWTELALGVQTTP